MNRKRIVSLLSLSLFIMLAPMCIYGATSEFRTISAEIIFSTYTPFQISHTAITSISAVDGVLNAKVKVSFGSFVSATAEMLYYKNGDSVNVLTVTKGTITNLSEFYIQTNNISSSDTGIDYQIKVTLKDKNGGTAIGYWPSDSVTYQHAVIISSASSPITGSTGGTIILGSGNQEYGDTSLEILPGSVPGAPPIITITQLPLTIAPVSPMKKASAEPQMIAQYLIEFDPTDFVPYPPAIATFYYGTETTATKFKLMRSDDQITWENVTIDSVNTDAKTISAKITKMGYYAIFESTNLDDNDYRPAKRAITKKGMENRAQRFEFNNLDEGDSVKIFNINGKKIREITSGDADGFVWDGRKDSGDWAESGTYIYQIKIKENGKLISGTIAFVK